MRLSTVLLAALSLGPPAFVACATATDTPDEGAGGSGGSEEAGGNGSGAATSTSGTISGSTTGMSSSTGAGGASCGDFTIGPGETCDPPASCPTSCEDFDFCTVDAAQGSAATCDVVCTHQPVSECKPDGCCGPGCNWMTDLDCPGCGNSELDLGEECDDGNLDETDACLSTCKDAKCGDGFIHLGFETCDDGNAIDLDGCSSVCAPESGTFGPVHVFASLSSAFFVTELGCSNSGGDPAGDALWFCQHFYNAGCTAEPVWGEIQSSTNPMMHSGINCQDPDPTGVSIPNTVCIGGPCKIGDYQGPLGGLTNLICDCP